MYEIYEKLLRIKGLKTADVAKATGLKPPTFSDWKSGKSRPNTDKLILIARYFGVTVEYLVTGEDTRIETPLFDEEQIDLITLYSQLNEKQKKAVFDLLHSFLP